LKVIGIGVDIVSVERILDVYKKYPESFGKRILSSSELVEFEKTRSKAAFLAKRFAAKEAVAKALGTGMTKGLCFTHISVDHEPEGRPVIRLEVDSVAGYRVDDLQFQLSISDEREYAIAYVMAMDARSMR
jgi:holo-[acyl-carrier protein] synthase